MQPLNRYRSLIQRSAALSRSNAYNNRPDQIERAEQKIAFAVKRNAPQAEDPNNSGGGGMIKDYMSGVFDKSQTIKLKASDRQ